MKTKLDPKILTILFALTLSIILAGCGGGGGNASGGDHPSAGRETDTSSPAIPANSSATPISSSRIDLSWDAATDNVGVTGYKIYRDGTYLKSVTELSTSDSPLNGGTRYCYRITAFDASGNESSQSADSCATTMPAWSGIKQMGTAAYDSAFGMTVDVSGNLYVTGVTYGDLDGNPGSGAYDVILVKYNDSGTRQWTKQIGASSDDYGNSVAADGNGNIYVAGYTSGSLDGNANAGKDDIILVKYNAAGTKQWSRQLGSPDVDEALSVAVDGSGNVYVAGATYSSLDGYTRAGEYDVVLVKYSSAGEKQWIRQLGSAATDEAYALAVDTSGNAYITGLTAGNLDGNTGAGGYDMFLVKYDTTGTKQWTKQLGTASDDYGCGVAMDSSGNIYVAGTTAGGIGGNVNAGGNDVFLVKFNAAGTVQWSRQLGSSAEDVGWGIAVDLSGNIFVAGSTDGDLDGNANAGNYDMFLVKYNTSGEKQWTRQMGSEFNDEAYGVAVNPDGNVFVTGYTYGNLDGNTNAGENDIFVAKYDTNGVRQ